MFKTAVTLLFVLVLVGGGQVRAQEGGLYDRGFALAPGDEVEVSIFSRPEYDTRALVEADGEIAVNGLGRVTAAGREVGDLERTLAEELAALGVTAPNVTVRVVAWREVGVLGDVAAPGLYPYRPGATILHMLARAGGFRRGLDGTDGDDLRLLESQVGLARLRAQLALAEVRRDRIAAEIADAEFQPALAPPGLRDYADSEAAITDAVAADRARDLAILERQRDAILEQIELRRQISGTYSEQAQRARANFERAEKLLSDGLTNSERVEVARDNLSRITVEQLENDSALARAVQDRSAVELAIAALTAPRTGALAREFRDAVSEATRLKGEIAVERDRLAVLEETAGETGPRLTGAEEEWQVSYAITRVGPDGTPATRAATETELVHPGDVITVTRRLMED